MRIGIQMTCQVTERSHFMCLFAAELGRFY